MIDDILQNYGWRKTFELIVDDLNATTQYYSDGTVIRPGACRLEEAKNEIGGFECAFGMSPELYVKRMISTFMEEIHREILKNGVKTYKKNIQKGKEKK